MFLPLMLQLPIVHGPDRQRQPGCLRKNIFVITKQAGPPQHVDHLLVGIGARAFGYGHGSGKSASLHRSLDWRKTVHLRFSARTSPKRRQPRGPRCWPRLHATRLDQVEFLYLFWQLRSEAGRRENCISDLNGNHAATSLLQTLQHHRRHSLEQFIA